MAVVDPPSTPPPPLPSAPDLAAARARPVSAALRLLLPLGVVLAVAAAILIATFAAGRWLLLDEAGARWLLARLPGVEVQGLRGALLGDALRADRLNVRWGVGNAVLIEDLRAEGLRWQWRPGDDLWVGLEATRLQARRVEVVTVPSASAAKVTDLTVPFRLTVAEAKVGEIHIEGLAPLRDVVLRTLTLDGRRDHQHAVAQFALLFEGNAIGGQASIGNTAPLPVSAQVTVTPLAGGDAPAWAAVLRVGGVLERLDLEATLRGVARGGRAAPALDLKAQVLPFAGWPLAALSAHTAALDLAALSPRAPETSLSGSAEVQSSARDAPIVANVQIDNARPGRWNERRLPVRRLELALRGEASAPDRLQVTRFEVWFADAARRAAGRWSGSAVWQGHTLDLDTRLAGVNPQRLDGRAAAMTLTGPLAATVRGLPSPDPAAKTTAPAWQADWRLDLEGRLDTAPQPVRLELQGSATATRLELRQLRARTGAASAELSATLQQAARGAWQVTSAGKLEDFDPLPWWPGDAGSAWRKGPHRLSGDWRFDLRVPPGAARLAPWALAQSLAGSGTLRVQRSLLAGVPLQAEVVLGRAGAATAAAASGTLHAELNLGGNQIIVEGRGNPAGSGQSDRWTAEMRAEKLGTLAPLAALHPALAEWVPRQGSVTGMLAAEGRWPAMRTEGSASVQKLRVGALAIDSGRLSWLLHSAGAQTLALQADAAGVEYGRQRAAQVHAELKGTVADHTIALTGTLPMAPAADVAQLLGLPAEPGTQVELKARGAWLPDAAGGGRWRAQVDRVALGGWDGKSATGPVAQAWAEALDLRAEGQFDAKGQLATVQAQPGRVRLGDALALRWDAVSIDLRGEHVRMALRADIDAFAVAPLLARLQPNAGWAGDLRLRARVDIKAAERFDADVVFERQDGDLNLVSNEGVQLFGLTEINLALSAHDGLWNFSQAFSGRTLGDIRGSVRVRTTPERRWPAPEDVIEGGIQARVADIGIWSNWVPPGWRLAGELRTTAAVSGRFGAPQYTGDITGTGLAVRNLLQGVNVSDGQVVIRLAGDVAQIEQFTLRAGDGTLKITGSASLGATPTARLQAVAQRFRVLGRVDRMIVASGNADLTLQSDSLKLDGSIKVDEGLFDASRSNAQRLDDDVIVRQAGDEALGPAEQAAPRPRRNVTVGLDIDLGQKLQVRGYGLDTTLRGALRLTTPGGRLALYGTINTERGTYKAYGQNLDIERGIIAFSGVPDNPRLDVLALRPNIDNRVGVAITGNLLTPRIRLYSDPEMSDNDKLSWLLLGRAPDSLGRADTALLQRAAMALLSGEGEAPTDALLRNLGIDQISVRQSEGEARDTVITLGRQISRRWFVGYERGVNATTGTFQLIYRIAQRFTLRAQSGSENSIDLIWIVRMNEAPVGGVRKSVTLPP